MRLDTRQLGYMVDCLVDGGYATDYFLGSDRIDVLFMQRWDPVVPLEETLRALENALLDAVGQLPPSTLDR